MARGFGKESNYIEASTSRHVGRNVSLAVLQQSEVIGGVGMGFIASYSLGPCGNMACALFGEAEHLAGSEVGRRCLLWPILPGSVDCLNRLVQLSSGVEPHSSSPGHLTSQRLHPFRFSERGKEVSHHVCFGGVYQRPQDFTAFRCAAYQKGVARDHYESCIST